MIVILWLTLGGLVHGACPSNVNIGAGMRIDTVKVGPHNQCTDQYYITQGDTLRFEAVWHNTETHCPGCIEQLHIGLKGTRMECLWSKNPYMDETGTYVYTFGPFNTPGVYEIHARGDWQYNCVNRRTGTKLVTVAVFEAASQNCEVSDWQPWSTCDCNFSKYRTRQVTRTQMGNGAACPSLTEYASCASKCSNNCGCGHLGYGYDGSTRSGVYLDMGNNKDSHAYTNANTRSSLAVYGTDYRNGQQIASFHDGAQWVWDKLELDNLSIMRDVYIQIDGDDALFLDTINVHGWDGDKVPGDPYYWVRFYGDVNDHAWCMSTDRNDASGWGSKIPAGRCYTSFRLDTNGLVYGYDGNVFGRRLLEFGEMTTQDFEALPEESWILLDHK